MPKRVRKAKKRTNKGVGLHTNRIEPELSSMQEHRENRTWVRHYTVSGMLGNIGLCEKHIGDFIRADFETIIARWKDFCLDCLDKHCNNLLGFCEEAIGFLPKQVKLWGELQEVSDEMLDLLSTDKVLIEGPENEKELESTKASLISVKEKFRVIRKKIAPVGRSLRRAWREERYKLEGKDGEPVLPTEKEENEELEESEELYGDDAILLI